MEKINLKSTFAHLNSFFRSFASENMNPELSWRIVISATVVGGVVIAILASLSYQWASSFDEVVVVKKSDKDTISLEEIRGVIDYYNEKQVQYQKLLTTRPVAPELGVNSGVNVSAVDISRDEILNVGNEAVAGTTTPR